MENLISRKPYEMWYNTKIRISGAHVVDNVSGND